MNLELFDFDLPDSQIAQRPASPRDSSRLLACRARGRLGEWSSSFAFSHHSFHELEHLLGPTDLLVMNDARVLPVRMLGHRLEGSGAVEALLLRKTTEREWVAIMHLSAKIKPGMQLVFEPGIVATILSTAQERADHEGEVRLQMGGLALDRIPLETWLERHGHVPLPPYIDAPDNESKAHYQTVYAAKAGSAAAPTAGFHFTDGLIERLAARGVETAKITLHIGIGTFRPIKTKNIDEHRMHEEIFEIPETFTAALERARREKRRVVAVGTTVVRALESWSELSPEGASGVFKTQIFIKPGHRFRIVDDLITNFHLPKSSLLVLVGAAMGIEPMKDAYKIAVQGGYRFFSYGDAMFIRGGNR